MSRFGAGGTAPARTSRGRIVAMNAQSSLPERIAQARRLHETGALAEARALYAALLERFPDEAEVLHLAGVAAYQSGDAAAAAVMIRKALAARPEFAPAWQNLVLPLLDLGLMDEAVAAGERAVSLAPEKPGVWTNYILALIRADRMEEAGRKAELAIAASPQDPAAWSQLGHVRLAQGHPADAERLLLKALAIAPNHEEALYNHGVAAQAQMHEAAAEKSYRAVLAANPAHRGARLNLGVALRSQGRIPEALAVWAASTIPPQDWPELAYDIACAHLMAGDWARGWPDYELRFQATNPIVRPPQTDAPRWQGENLAGGTLLVHHEQGLGDTIQFVRLLAAIEDRVGRIALICQLPLHGLLSTMTLFRPGSRHALLREGAALPEHAAWTALLSLPAILRLDQANLPRRVPYLAAPAERIPAWAQRLDQLGGTSPRPFRVGLVWQGNPKAPVEKGRSIPLAHFAPLGSVPGVRFFALQKGVGREQAVPAGLDLLDLGPDFDTGADAFLDSAAVLAGLDLLITSDTSMAHLAGALGRPVWLLVKHVPDWRWGQSGRLMPWYPSMRVFRQSKPGDWDGLMAQVRSELALLAGLRGAGEGATPSFDKALAAHQAGRYAEAIAQYRGLAARGDDARVLNFLGMALLEAGARSPAAAQEALPFVLRSVGLGSGDADLFANLAVVLRQTGPVGDAREALSFAFAFDPGHRSAGLNLINLELGERRTAQAYARALELAARFPADGSVLSAAAGAAKADGRLPEAEAAIRRAIAAEPANARHHILLGSILLEAGQYKAADKAWSAALALAPGNADVLSNLGVYERNHGDGALAVWFGRRAVAADPRHAEAWCNLGIAANDRGLAALGQEALGQSIRLRPDYAEARMALGMNLLGEGRMAEGWPEYEWRLRSEQLGLGLQPGRLAPWTGQDPRGRSFLLICEQGFGDAIQFIRYAAILKAAGAARVVIGCRYRLKALLGRAEGVDAIIGEGEKLPEVDYFVPLMSMPYRMGTRMDAIPAAPAYLQADPERVTRWAGELAAGKGFRIGLIWQGNPDAKVDRGRSMPLAALEPLARIPGVRFIALQKGPGVEQIEAVADRFTVETLGEDFDAGPDAFADTAAVMMNLDLVISSDTAAPHLAGALGRPVWLFVKALPEWRWFSGADDTPWYPSMRLFRQARPGPDTDPAQEPWTPVVERMAIELERLVAGDLSRRLPQGEIVPAPRIEPIAVRFERAFAAHRAGDFAAALPVYADILVEEPAHTGALHMLGAMAVQRQAYERGLYFLDAAKAAGETAPELDTNRAVALRHLNRTDEAETVLRAVLLKAPSAEAALTLGNILRDRGRPKVALALFDTAVTLQPDQAKAHRGRANALKDLGRMEDALEAFEQAVIHTPEDADLHLDRAHALLYAGKLREGFAEYEWRWRASELTPHGHDAPLWDGERYEGRTLLIHGEQGLGDHIQFARFFPAAAARGGKLIVEVRRALFGLFRSLIDGGKSIELVEQGCPLPAYDLQLPMLSLPYVLDIDEGDLPGAIPYMAPDPARLARWRERFAGSERLNVGLIWQGNPQARADKGRSPPLAALAPLFTDKRVRYLALQKEHGLDQLEGLPFARMIQRPGPAFDAGPDAFLDTMAVMGALDLVVTSDTAAAHLAGALGRPALLMLKHVPDWRWQGTGTTSPWYPSLTLVRQPEPGDWASVAREVAAMIAERAQTL